MNIKLPLAGLLLLVNAALAAGATTEATVIDSDRAALATKVNTFKTVAEGAAIGAAVGAGVGYLTTDKDPKGARNGALIGGAVGGLLGGAVASAQKRFAKREDQLRQMADTANKQNAELADIVASARTMLASDRDAVTKLRKQVATARGNAKAAAEESRGKQADDMRQDLELYDQAIAASEKQLNQTRTALADYRRRFPNDQDQPDVVAVASAVDAFEQKRTEMQGVRNEHAELLAAIEGSPIKR